VFIFLGLKRSEVPQRNGENGHCQKKLPQSSYDSMVNESEAQLDCVSQISFYKTIDELIKHGQALWKRVKAVKGKMLNAFFFQ
jgi:hypothetical protein